MMKLTINQEELSRVLTTVSKALPSRASIPILSGILIETTANGIQLTGSDLEFSARQTIPATIEEAGSVVVGKQLTEIIRNFSSGPVEISADDRTAVIKSKRSKFELPTMPVSEYPEVAKPEGDSFTVNADDLKQAIKQTMFATVQDDPRPFLSSVLWEIYPDKLRLVATDVNRLAIKEIKISGNVTGMALVPVKALREIGNVITGEVTIYVTKGQIFVTGNGLTLGVRLVDAQFPKYEQILPKDFAGRVTVNRPEFIKTLERAALMGDSVKLSIDDEQITVSNKEPGKGQFNEETTAKQDGQPIEIGFNAKFLLDFLKAVDDDEIEFSYSASQRPVMAKVGDYQYIVMPLKLA